MRKPISKTQLARLASITLSAEPEETPIEGNACATGDAALDDETNALIRFRLASGGEWAWCTAVVTATYDGVEAVQTLGCCSYGDEGDFKRGSGYYGDMRRAALAELHTKLIERDQKLAATEPVSFIAMSYRQAITTKYGSGGRIFVRSQAGSARIPYDYALDNAGNHAAAAREYALRMQWSGQWVGGCLPDGHSYAFVLLPESMSA